MRDALLGQRVLITQSSEFMGPALCEVFREQRAEVVASAASLSALDAPAQVVREAGRIDILVAYLALMAPATPAADVSDREWREVFAALVDPLPRLIRAATAEMILRRSGKVCRSAFYASQRGSATDDQHLGGWVTR